MKVARTEAELENAVATARSEAAAAFGNDAVYMNGYLLAKQMGGDAGLYASVATIQTAASFVTIPLVLLITGYVAAG